jgi:TRAP-type C4-dicarboxylate transport system substrate-binding protein
LPFQLSSSPELFALEDGPFGAAVLNDISDNQLRALALFTKGMSQLAANRTVKSRKDLVKLKVATLGVESDQVLEKLGGRPIRVSALLSVEYKKQNIDAFEWIPQATELVD